MRVGIRSVGIAYFNGLYSSGFECQIPRGAELQVYSTSGILFQCALTDPALEQRLAPQADRRDTKHAGHAFTFGLGDLGRHLEVVV